jgi:hypothetical protein
VKSTFVLGILSVVALGIGHSPAVAVEILVNGSLEASASPPNWSLSQTITGMPGASVNAAEQVGFANQPNAMSGQLGLLLRPNSGNEGTYAGQNLPVNVILSQTRPGVATTVGQTYTFSGYTKFGGNDGLPETTGYSGGVDLLHTGSPSDPTPGDGSDPPSVASPTETFFELAFLDASNNIVDRDPGPAVDPALATLDLRTVQANDNVWRQHSVSLIAPSGATQVRVRAMATDMVENYGFQETFFDNFSLTRSGSPTVERLVNGGLNIQGAPHGYTLETGPCPGGNCAPSASFRNFANHTPGGQFGLWFKSFANVTDFEPDIESVDGTMSQVVAATAGADYTFSAWTAWERGYSGGLIHMGSTTQTLMRMEFLDSSMNPIPGETLELDLYAAGMRNDEDGPTNNIEPEDWRQFSLAGTAPANTESVRISIAGLGMFKTEIEPQSAFFDDFSLDEVLPGLLGDFNDDGKVDAADYAPWAKNTANAALPNDNGVDTQAERYALWSANFGNPQSGSGGGGAVPEPGSLILAAVGVALLAGKSRQKRTCG